MEKGKNQQLQTKEARAEDYIHATADHLEVLYLSLPSQPVITSTNLHPSLITTYACLLMISILAYHHLDTQ